VLTAALSATDQIVYFEIDFGTAGVDLSFATVYARVWLRSGGPSGDMKIYVQDVTPTTTDEFAATAYTFSSTTRTGWSTMIHPVGMASGSFDPTHVRRVVFRISSGVLGSAWSTSTIWLDSIRIERSTGAPLPGPFTFDTSVAPLKIFGTPTIGYGISWLL
jgi:hypothetical protein